MDELKARKQVAQNVYDSLQQTSSSRRDIIHNVFDSLPIVPLTTSKSYFTNESKCFDGIYAISGIPCCCRVYKKFTLLVAKSAIGGSRFLVYRNVYDGERIKELILYYDCVLMNPNVRIDTRLVTVGEDGPFSTSKIHQRCLKYWISSEDVSLDPDLLGFYYLDKKKCQCIVVKKENVEHYNDFVSVANDFTHHKFLNGVKTMQTLVEFEDSMELFSFPEEYESLEDDTKNDQECAQVRQKTVCTKKRTTRVNKRKRAVARHAKNSRKAKVKHTNASKRCGRSKYSPSDIKSRLGSAPKKKNSIRQRTESHAVFTGTENGIHSRCEVKPDEELCKFSDDCVGSQYESGDCCGCMHKRERVNDKTGSTTPQSKKIMNQNTQLQDIGQQDIRTYQHKRKKQGLRPIHTRGSRKARLRETHAPVAQEAQPGSSSLHFSTEQSVYHALSNYTPSSGSDLFYRQSASQSARSSTTRSGGGLSHLQHADELKRKFLGLSYRNSVDRQPSATSGGAGASLFPSETRSVSQADKVEVCDFDPAVDIEDIIKLISIRGFSEILRRVGTISKHLPPATLILRHFLVGVCYFKLVRYDEAKEHFATCERTAKREHRDGDVMLCNAYLGDMEYANQMYVQAAKYYKKGVGHYAFGSVALMLKLTPPTISAVYAKLASSYRNANMMIPAIENYKTAIREALSDRDRLSAHTSLGNLYQSMGDNSNALEQYKESIQLAEKLSDYISLGWAYGNIGNAYLGLNRKDEALYHLQKSLDLAIEYERTPQAIGRTYNNLGTAYQSMSDLDKAEEYYGLALSQAIYGNDIPGQARVRGNIGNVYMLRKKYKEAVPEYEEVLILSKDPSTINTARHNKGCAYYEWATSLSTSSYSKVFVHGPDCKVKECERGVSPEIKSLYQQGSDDLREVVKYHEERLQHIKGSSNSLTLSVSLIESNSRTFHRLQDCLVKLHKFDEALVVAEQSRARTLGELLLKRKGNTHLNSPISFDQIVEVVKEMEQPLVYFSYTGARLNCWMFVPVSGQITWNFFEVPLADDQFDGKSFDYYLRYSLTEKLVERSFEMYKSIEYDDETSREVQKLFELVGKPVVSFLQKYCHSLAFEHVTVISDSYTTLLPLTCLRDSQRNSFLGDCYYFNMAPSILTMGIMNKCVDKRVDVQGNCNDVCIVGDPNIPPFYHNGEVWYLGRLPFAKKEAEWVAHFLHASPMHGDQATKSSLLIRLMKAKIVHIATHGSASAGFLAFSAFAVSAPSGTDRHVDGSNVLLYPEDVEKLHISPALVVLSSCDSGRGTVKADGIQGMARAFILAGAQSVLTTLWKVPDESASVFMQFFYQYLLDGHRSSLALQKAILSVRCFAKYSQYIHWSGYQLTGQDTIFDFKSSSSPLEHTLGEASAFPRLADVKKLEKVLVNDPRFPTDVQILLGSAGVEPSEVVNDFISSFHSCFSGGIFWINCRCPEMIEHSIEYIEKICGNDLPDLPVSEAKQVLFVLDSMTELPNNEKLLKVLKNHHVHIIAIPNSCIVKNDRKLVNKVDSTLIRGCSYQDVEPLTNIHSTQRLVHTLMKNIDFAPTTADQQMFEKLSEFTLGSPPIVETTAQVLLDCYKNDKRNVTETIDEMLLHHDDEYSEHSTPVRSVSENVIDVLPTLQCEHRDVWDTGSVHDSWDSIASLINYCELSIEEGLLLKCLSVFGCFPVPLFLVTRIASAIAESSKQPYLARKLDLKLTKYKLLKPYPSPVVSYHTASRNHIFESTQKIVHVPQHIAGYLWNSLGEGDKVVALTLVKHSITPPHQSESFLNSSHSPVCSVFEDFIDQNYTLIGKEAYQAYQSECQFQFNCQVH